MADYRLKIKIGEHEFEAEGSADAVQSQFEMFKELILRTPTPSPSRPEQKENPPDGQPNGDGNGGNGNGLDLEKIMRLDGRTVSLTVRADSGADAVLLLLLGQRHFRSNDSVTGSELASGLQQSGYGAVRGDHVTNRLANDGSVITIGEHRGRRYRLTNTGVARAQQIARALIATVP